MVNNVNRCYFLIKTKPKSKTHALCQKTIILQFRFFIPNILPLHILISRKLYNSADITFDPLPTPPPPLELLLSAVAS